MYIQKIHIENFKGYFDFTLELGSELNIIVGNNEAKKTTIIEAINLVLNGYIDGRYLNRENLNQFLFNKGAVDEYLARIEAGQRIYPPEIVIEVFFDSDDKTELVAELEGANNSTKAKAYGLYMRIALKQDFIPDYLELIYKNRDLLKSLPLEYYDIELVRFSGTHQARVNIPLRASLVDASSSHNDTSDLIISRIIKSELEEAEKLQARQLHRSMKDHDRGNTIYTALKKHITDPHVTVSLDPSSKNSWDSHLCVYYKEIPFGYIGKGKQTILKTEFSLTSSKTQKAGVVLVEEPENHLSHTRLNQIVQTILDNNDGKQVVISTHSSFIANKLDLGNLILLENGKSLHFNSLDSETGRFFKKLPGYDTLRILLCDSAILVEGDADELIVQRAFKDIHGVLPIQMGIEVISVNNTFERFLQIGAPLEKKIAVAIDVDNRLSDRQAMFDKWSGPKALTKDHIKIYFEENDAYTGSIPKYNNNTLEPLLLKYNSQKVLDDIFDETHATSDDLLKYMKANKTECALTLFDSSKAIKYPKYILEAISFVKP